MAAAALGLAAALPGCAGPPAAPRLPGVSVTVLQYRSDIPLRRVQLQVANRSRASVVVLDASLSGGGYAPAPAWSDDRPAEIGAGATVDLPATLTAARCAVTGRPQVRLRVRTEEGAATVAVPTTDSHGTLADLRRSDCFAARAARVARFAFPALERRPGGRAVLHLTVAPGPDAADGLTVVRVLPTTLLSPPTGQDVWTLGTRIDEEGPEELPLPALPTRCDLHAIAEDKIGSVLPVTVRLADGTTGTVNVVAPPAVKQQVLSWVSDTCAVGR